jgi:hypothetical protein
MKHLLLTTALVIPSWAFADTSSLQTSSHGLLENQWVKAGINKDSGTFGSGGRTSPGLLFDPTGSGTFDPRYDYLTPGSPFDGQSLKVDGANKTNNNTGGATIVDSDGLTDGTDSLTWSGDVDVDGGTWNVENKFILEDDKPYIDVETKITAGSDADTVAYGKFIDPDSQGMPGDSSSTDNVLGYSGVPDTNIAFSEATVSKYALGVYSTDTNTTAGVNRWSTDADSYDGTSYTDDDGNPVNYGNSDDTIGISWSWTGVSAGDILSAKYAYIFGPSAFDALDDAVDGGAGGGTAGELPSGWSLDDVGSATDAAESGGEPAAPTVVSTATETITSTSEAVSTTLPVLTGAITTHDASTDDGVQTIDRETTTTVTTPMNVTTTSFVRTTDTMSDGSEVVTDGESTSTTVVRNDAVVTVTDPGSFVGRMDQASQLIGLNTHRNLDIADGVSIGRINHSMGDNYEATSSVVGIGHTFVTEDALRLSLGINRIDTTLSEGGDGKALTNAVTVEAGKAIEDKDITVVGRVNMAKSDIEYSRTIGTFSAAGETAASDVSAGLTIEKSTGAIRPFGGLTIGKSSIDGWTETGDIQAVITTAESDTAYRYGTIGFNINEGPITATFSKNIGDNDAANIRIGFEQEINEYAIVGVDYNRTLDEDNSSNYFSAGIKIRF